MQLNTQFQTAFVEVLYITGIAGQVAYVQAMPEGPFFGLVSCAIDRKQFFSELDANNVQYYASASALMLVH